MSEGLARSRSLRWSAWVIWIVVGISMSVLSVTGVSRTVTGAYRSATVNWFAGQPLYNMQGSGFIYWPQMAIFFAPWGLLPIPVGEVAWRCTALCVLAIGVFRFTRLMSSDDRWFQMNTIVSAATAVGVVRNGQATVMITGLMLLACVELARQRWTLATILLVMALGFKPTSAILILLVGALYVPMLWRLVLGLMFFAILPFLTQEPGYVWSQIDACIKNSQAAVHVGETDYWAQFFGMFKVAGLDVPPMIQKGVGAIAGLGTLGLCWIATRKLPRDRGSFYLFAISTCYLMLFNPRTEGSTYAMIAPAYGILLANAWLVQRNPTATWCLIAAIVATVLNYDLVHLFTRKPHVEVWLCPFICLVVTCYLILELRREISLTSFSNGIPERTA